MLAQTACANCSTMTPKPALSPTASTDETAQRLAIWLAGWTARRGIRFIEIDQRNYKAHRLAWLYVHGVWPTGEIDHRNGDPRDNRIANLRDVTHAVNLQNLTKPRAGCKSGMLGAQWDASRQKWKASIRTQGASKHLGRFDTPEEAHEAYKNAKRKLHDGCTI
jgi:hypothetical protein